MNLCKFTREHRAYPTENGQNTAETAFVYQMCYTIHNNDFKRGTNDCPKDNDYQNDNDLAEI